MDPYSHIIWKSRRLNLRPKAEYLFHPGSKLSQAYLDHTKAHLDCLFKLIEIRFAKFAFVFQKLEFEVCKLKIEKIFLPYQYLLKIRLNFT